MSAFKTAAEKNAAIAPVGYTANPTMYTNFAIL